MATAQTPRGINHVVLNVRDIEVSHRFWTEIMGFRCVAQLKPRPDRVRPRMRFYSGVSESGDVTHHDLALAEAPKRETVATRREAEQAGLVPFGEMDGATPCFCVKDPDGHTVELYAVLPA